MIVNTYMVICMTHVDVNILIMFHGRNCMLESLGRRPLQRHKNIKVVFFLCKKALVNDESPK